jgi:hypothetical protein
VGVLAAVRRFRSLAILGLALYLVVLFVSPVLHHDLACHMKAPGHCDACAASPVASRTEATALFVAPTLDPGRTLEISEARPPRAASRVSLGERAPPASL